MITKYMDTPIQGVGQPVFLFPWAVLQELDRLCSHADTAVLERVNRAVEALQTFIRREHRRIFFQSYKEASLLVTPCAHAYSRVNQSVVVSRDM